MNIWTCAPQSTLEPIEISMKKAIRTLSFAKYDAHSGPLFKAYNTLNFPDLLKLQQGKLQWDLRNGSYPEFLKKNLLFDNISRAERLRPISQKFIPLSRTKYKANFLSSTGLTCSSIDLLKYFKRSMCWRDISSKIKDHKSKKNVPYIIENIYFRKDENSIII